MIQGALIFMCGVWVGVIAGLFLAGAARQSERADRTEIDNDQPPIR